VFFLLQKYTLRFFIPLSPDKSRKLNYSICAKKARFNEFLIILLHDARRMNTLRVMRNMMLIRYSIFNVHPVSPACLRLVRNPSSDVSLLAAGTGISVYQNCPSGSSGFYHACCESLLLPVYAGFVPNALLEHISQIET
jgi:hypothetical protein